MFSRNIADIIQTELGESGAQNDAAQESLRSRAGVDARTAAPYLRTIISALPNTYFLRTTTQPIE